MKNAFVRNRFSVILTVIVLAAFACSLPGGGGDAASPTSTPEVVTIVVTATNPPEPTPTESSKGLTGPTATTKQDLNVRGGPSTGFSITTFLPGGTTVPVIGKNDAGTWLLVALDDGGSGWISTYYTDTTDLSGVPVVDAPPPPQASSGGSSGSGSSGGSSGSGGSGSSGGSSGSGGSGGGGAPSDSDITTDINIKNDAKSFNGVISYPNGDSTDRVYVRAVGFDSTKHSGNIIFSLTCSGDGVANVKVQDVGNTTSGSPGCNKTWTNFFGNDSDRDTIKIYFNSGSGNVNWTLVISANN